MTTMVKIPLDHDLWKQLNNPLTPAIQKLVEQFTETPDASLDSELFAELSDRIFESNTIYPSFYFVLPHLVDAAIKDVGGVACDLWEWMGSWLAEGYQPYLSHVPQEVMSVYQSGLHIAQAEVIRFICQYDFSLRRDSVHYLLGAPFSFVRPIFGSISSMFDTEIQDEATCPNQHTALYTICKKGIRNNKNEKTSAQDGPYEQLKLQIHGMPLLKENAWNQLQIILEPWEDSEEKQLATIICKKGICRDTPLSIAAFLYSYLLQNLSQDKGDITFAQLCRHMLDPAICPQCGETFSFIDGWNRSMSSIVGPPD